MRAKKKKRIEELTAFTEEYAILVNNLNYSTNNEEIINRISFTLNRGDTLVIMGPSGSGKTILLKLLFGLLLPVSGEVFINGTDTSLANQEQLLDIMKDMEFVFQYGALMSNMNVYDNLALMSRYHGIKSEKELKKDIEDHLRYFNISRRMNVRPSELTLNEMKAVSFCRIMLNDFNMVFFDDPFASVDEVTSRKMLKIIQKLRREDKTLVIVTLDLEFAYNIADYIALMDNGRFEFLGSPIELRNDKSEKVKELVSRIYRLAEVRKEEVEE